jgi:hypothetical protein
MAIWAGPNGQHGAQHDLARPKHGPTRIRMAQVSTTHYGGPCLGRCRGTWAGTGTTRLSGWHDLACYIFPYTLESVMSVIVWTYYT